jgi:hypothetical protein
MARADQHRRTRRRGAALLAVAALTLAGCGGEAITDLAFEGGEREEQSFTVEQPVEAVDLEIGAGEIDVVGEDRSTVEGEVTLQWRGDRPELTEEVRDGTLVLRQDCSQCGFQYTVQVPADVDLTLAAATGSIDGRGLRGESVAVDVGTGDVDLTFDAAPRDVVVEAGTGDVDIEVPDEPYDVTTDVGVGDTSVDVNQSGDADRSITVEVGVGQAAIER